MQRTTVRILRAVLSDFFHCIGKHAQHGCSSEHQICLHVRLLSTKCPLNNINAFIMSKTNSFWKCEAASEKTFRKKQNELCHRIASGEVDMNFPRPHHAHDFLGAQQRHALQCEASHEILGQYARRQCSYDTACNRDRSRNQDSFHLAQPASW